TAAANVLTWWARRGFARLLDSVRYNVPDRLEGDTDSVPNVSDQLARAMNTDTLKTGCTSLDSIAPGILSVCNDPAWNNGYNFESFLAWNDHDLLIREIDAGRPGVLGLLGHPEYGSHAVTFCGWGPPDDRWIMVHDLWAGTPVDRVINFDYGGPVAVIPVVPGKSAAPDISIVAIIQPAESVAPGLITPQAELANDGSVSGTATACFRIIDELTGSDCYTASVAVTMEPDKRASVEFPAWQALAGNYVACCSLTMSGSTSPLSSVVRTRFTVAPARLAGGYAPIVRVSPNPASRTVIVSGWTGFGQASIFDPAGRLIHHSSLVTQNSSALLDLGSLPSGCYLLRLDRTGSTPVCCSFLVSH
ncbi:MAG: T9SS type A sorting domain-containing protein, partial [candidate division WOR-3 bacterium]